jgi:Uma2 family endonuclease
MGLRESLLALEIGRQVGNFLERNDLGFLGGADGPFRLFPGLVRLPDLSFVSWGRLPGREIPSAPVPDLTPDLAVEVLSEGNTAAEMRRKLREFFKAGVRLVWIVDPPTRTIEVFTAPNKSTVLTEDQTLDGGDVLPGFTLPLRKLFDRGGKAAPERGPARPASRPRRPRRKDGR